MNVPQIEGLQRVLDILDRRLKKARNLSPSVVVGYTASYAIFVHENLEAFHPVGQAKFLEQPLREYEAELSQIVLSALKQGRSLEQALLLAGLALQRESQKLVPVDTGNLKNSAFTKVQ